MNEKIKELMSVLNKELPPLNDGIVELKARLDAMDERLSTDISRQQEEMDKFVAAQQEKFINVDKKHNTNNSKIEDLRKDLQYLKEDLEYYKGSVTKTESVHSPPNTMGGAPR